MLDLTRATDSLGQVTCPVVHKGTSAVEQVRAGTGHLDSIAEHMCQGRLYHLPGMIGLFTCSVSEAGAEPVRHRRNSKRAQQPLKLLVVEGLLAAKSEHQCTGSLAE